MMKKLIKTLMLVACIAMGSMVSCSPDQTSVLYQEEDLKMSLLDSEFKKEMIEKVGEVRANEILQQMNNPTTREPVVYEGELCPGVVSSGDVLPEGFPDFDGAGIWYFSGVAGDVVSIQVDRVNCEMDPIVALYEGFGDLTLGTGIAFADDNNGVPCTPVCSSFSDPLISGFTLPITGVYSVVVWDFFSGSCTNDPMTYNLTATGFEGSSFCVTDADGDGCDDATDPHPNSNQDATVNIDGCDSGVDNVFVTDCSTMNDLIADCAANASNHGDFVSCVTHLTNEWKAAGYIVGNEKGAIISCAAQSNIF